jgi:hypothetical protein
MRAAQIFAKYDYVSMTLDPPGGAGGAAGGGGGGAGGAGGVGGWRGAFGGRAYENDI